MGRSLYRGPMLSRSKGIAICGAIKCGQGFGRGGGVRPSVGQGQALEEGPGRPLLRSDVL